MLSKCYFIFKSVWEFINNSVSLSNILTVEYRDDQKFNHEPEILFGVIKMHIYIRLVGIIKIYFSV